MPIRHGGLADAARLAEFGARSFHDTFAGDNTEENIRLYLERTYSPDIQRDELADPNVLFLIAEDGDEWAGYVKLTLNSTNESVSADRPIELERIYTAAKYIGKGVGKALMGAAIEEARRRECDVIWLGVWEKNPRAIAFYKKWGFSEVGEHTFMLGNEAQRDLLMQLYLVSGSMKPDGN